MEMTNRQAPWTPPFSEMVLTSTEKNLTTSPVILNLSFNLQDFKYFLMF